MRWHQVTAKDTRASAETHSLELQIPMEMDDEQQCGKKLSIHTRTFLVIGLENRFAVVLSCNGDK